MGKPRTLCCLPPLPQWGGVQRHTQILGCVGLSIGANKDRPLRHTTPPRGRMAGHGVSGGGVLLQKRQENGPDRKFAILSRNVAS